jgi:hypothetical protein
MRSLFNSGLDGEVSNSNHHEKQGPRGRDAIVETFARATSWYPTASFKSGITNQRLVAYGRYFRDIFLLRALK